MNRLSGDQKNGGSAMRNTTDAVLAERTRTSSEPRSRIHKRATPSEPVAANARWRPSGDTANAGFWSRLPEGEIWN
jgi:hypothetical protein